MSSKKAFESLFIPCNQVVVEHAIKSRERLNLDGIMRVIELIVAMRGRGEITSAEAITKIQRLLGR